MSAKKSYGSYKNFNDFNEDPYFLYNLFELKYLALKEYEKKYSIIQKQLRSEAKKIKRIKIKQDPIIKKYIKSEDKLLEKISTDSEDYSEEFKIYQNSANALLKGNYNKAAYNRIITERQAQEMII
jgi:hypothetical protein